MARAWYLAEIDAHKTRKQYNDCKELLEKIQERLKRCKPGTEQATKLEKAAEEVNDQMDYYLQREIEFMIESRASSRRYSTSGASPVKIIR